MGLLLQAGKGRPIGTGSQTAAASQLNERSEKACPLPVPSHNISGHKVMAQAPLGSVEDGEVDDHVTLFQDRLHSPPSSLFVWCIT